MFGKSSSPAAWWSALEPAPAELFHGRGDADDPRLGELTYRWAGGIEPASAQAALIGFCSDEGTRRNLGRPGAALAPNAIRDSFYRLTTWDPLTGVDLALLELVDLGNLPVGAELESAQQRLGDIVGAIMKRGSVPVLLGGGHDTTFGHYLGYAAAGIECCVINIDAHLDVRPTRNGANSGTPFRQAIEHPTHPLKLGRYVVIGAQRQSCARAHVEFVEALGGRIHWMTPSLNSQCALQILADELERLARETPAVLVTVDVDAFCQADVPGCSAPSPFGLEGSLWPELAHLCGQHPSVRSLDIVEANPTFDRDGQTCRWAAAGMRQFFVGMAKRCR